MILTGDEILRQHTLGNIIIDPFEPDNIGANSIDLTLSNKLVHYWEALLDMRCQNSVKELIIPESGLVLWPNEIYLGSTNERCGSDHFVTCLEGRSSVGRLGIEIHRTAGFGDLGFKSNWTLEISVIRPVRVYPNVRICQAIFHTTFGARTRLYEGKYKDQRRPVPSMMYKDFTKED